MNQISKLDMHMYKPHVDKKPWHLVFLKIKFLILRKHTIKTLLVYYMFDSSSVPKNSYTLWSNIRWVRRWNLNFDLLNRIVILINVDYGLQQLPVSDETPILHSACRKVLQRYLIHFWYIMGVIDGGIFI